MICQTFTGKFTLGDGLTAEIATMASVPRISLIIGQVMFLIDLNQLTELAQDIRMASAPTNGERPVHTMPLPSNPSDALKITAGSGFAKLQIGTQNYWGIYTPTGPHQILTPSQTQALCTVLTDLPAKLGLAEATEQ